MLFEVSVFCRDISTDASALEELSLLNGVGIVQSDEPYIGFRFEGREHTCKIHGKDCLSSCVGWSGNLWWSVFISQPICYSPFELSYLVGAPVFAVSELLDFIEYRVDYSVLFQACLYPRFPHFGNLTPVLLAFRECLFALTELFIIECYHELLSIGIILDMFPQYMDGKGLHCLNKWPDSLDSPI